MTLEMPIPYTPLYIGLASFVADLLGSVAESMPQDIDQRAGDLDDSGNQLSELVQECVAALQSGFGTDSWSGAAADSGRDVLSTLLRQLAQQAQQANQEAASLKQIATLLKSAQDYYTKQATAAEQIVSSLLASPFSRPFAQMMAVVLGLELAETMSQFEQAIAALASGQLSPLWNDDTDQVVQGMSFPDTSTSDEMAEV